MAIPSEFPNLALIRQGIHYRFEVKCRGLVLSLRPLSISEEDQISQEVIEQMSELQDHQKTSLKQSILLAMKKLERASTTDVGAQDWKITCIELERFTPGEVDHLFKQYVAKCDVISPMFDRLPREMVEKLVEGLKKNSKDLGMILTELSFFQLVDICHHLLTTGELPTGN